MKKTFRILVPLMLVLLILASIVWYLFVYDRGFTRDTLLSQARFQDLHGNSRISALFYDMAYTFSDHDEDVAIELANQYKADGNYTKAEYTLTIAIHNNPSAELYSALSKTFVEQDKLLDAVTMLDNISDASMKQQLDEMRPSAPVSDYPAGFYSQYMDIHLHSSSDTMYYSTDGEYPTTSAPAYSGSVSLPAGETTVYAIAVDESGLVSPATVLNYTITGIIEEVTFTDPTMEAAIRELIGADADDKVFTNQLWEIKEFSVPMNVSDLSDLRLLPYVENLTILDQTLTTLEPVSSLEKLTTLDLTGCEFPTEDLEILAQLPSLARLTLADCGLSTIAGLAGAPGLTHLNLSNNTLRKLDVLAPMSSLLALDLQHNAVTDLSDLSGLINLETLNISYNAVSSIKPITGCLSLTHLEATNNDITSLKGMGELPFLTHLAVDYNELTGVGALAGCKELTYLSIGSNEIEDITKLSALTKLEYLDFSSNKIEELPKWPDGCPLITINGSYNQLTSISSLKNMQSMTHVYMDYNLLTDIDALADCFCLVQINVFGNDIKDVSKLRDHDIIVNYDPTK